MVALIVNGKPISIGPDNQTVDFKAEPSQQKGFLLYQRTPQGKMYLSLDPDVERKSGFILKPLSKHALLITPRPPTVDCIQIYSSEQIELDFNNIRVLMYMSIAGNVTNTSIVALWLSGIIVVLGLVLLVWKIPQLQKELNEIETPAAKHSPQIANGSSPQFRRGA
jgi:hypothetical protein